MPQVADPRAGTTPRAHAQRFSAIDCWQPVGLLNDGQWTSVYQARPIDCPDDWPSDYAIKVLKPQFVSDQLAVSQIRREATVGRTVTHPHLISFLSAHVSGSPYYVLMPYLGGSTLANLLLTKRTLCVPQTLWIARQTADALEALHRHRWLHADVKPSNIFVSSQGHVTLIDLGFARPFEAPHDETNELVGTLNYAAPEVFVPARGRSGQSDIYSLGVILYEMLTRRLPFAADDAGELALAHLRNRPPDPRTLAPALPHRVVRLLRRMLAKEPLRRPLAKDLVQLLMELEIETFHEWCLDGADP